MPKKTSSMPKIEIMEIKHADFSKLQPLQINDVLKKLGTVDLIHYSTISDTCLNNVKNLRPKRSLNFDIKSYPTFKITPGSSFRITLVDGDDPAGYNSEQVIVKIEPIQDYRRGGKKTNFNGHLVRTVCRKTEPKTIQTFWGSPIDGFVFMMDYLSLIFDSPPIYQILMGSETPEERNHICEWIKNNRNSEVELLTVMNGSKLNNSQLKQLLHNVQATVLLTLHDKVNRNFSYKFARSLPRFECNSSEWITPKQLLEFNHETFKVRVNLSNKVLSNFLKKCIDGALPELKHCEIVNSNPEMDVDEIVEGVNHEKTRSEVKQLRDPLNPRMRWRIDARCEYQCVDDEVLTVRKLYGAYTNSKLDFFIWSKNDIYEESEKEEEDDSEDEDEDEEESGEDDDDED